MKNEVANIIIALIACLALGELLISWLQGKRTHTLRESISSITMGIGQQAIGVYIAGSMVLLYAAIETRVGLFDFRMDTWWHWPLLFGVSDFCYYWAHRTAHTRNFWVAGHIPHHHSEEFNLISSFRQGWTAWTINSVFFLPLPLLGFPIEMTGLGQAAILVVQFLAHNGLIERKLGPLEWVFITPANHRVHHGRNEPYLGANCGGMFCIWDRIFGTYQQATPENPVQLGVSMPLDFYDPIEANLDYYRRLVFVSRHRQGLARLTIWFSTPQVLLAECDRYGFQPVRLLDRGSYDPRRSLILLGITLALLAAFGVHRIAYQGNPWPLRLATGALVAAILYAAGRAMAGPRLQEQLA